MLKELMHMHLVRHNKTIDIRQSRKVYASEIHNYRFSQLFALIVFNKHEKQANASVK